MQWRPLTAAAIWPWLRHTVLPRAFGVAVLTGVIAAAMTTRQLMPVVSPTEIVAAGVAARVPEAPVAPPGAAPGPSASTRSAPGPSAPTRSAPGPSAPTPAADATPDAAPAGGQAELPRGGRSLFPRYRLVGYSGGPGSAAFGRLGVGDLDQRVDEIERLARSYAGDREPLPVLELIAVVAHPRPSRDGLYRDSIDPAVIEQYLAAARRHRALLLLNIQPGRSDFLTEVRALRRWLLEPDVGLALDPEWAVGPRETPGRVFGSTTGAELESVSRYVADLVIEQGLPEKPIVVHQLAARVLVDEQQLRPRYGVVVIKSVDGIGTRAEKTATWTRLVKGMPQAYRPGFKLFFVEDRASGPLMTPAQVLALRPQPEYVLYE